MPMPSAESSKQMQLRLDAEGRLQRGAAPATQGWSTGAEALSLLHSLASNPDSASDALKLLHELQVHQVELDLQHEQMEQNQREMEGALGRYSELYEFAPAGYFTVSPEGKIMEANVAGARLLGLERDEAGGRRLDSFMTPESRPALLALVRQAQRSGKNETCVVQTGAAAADGSAPRTLQVVAGMAPQSQSLLLILTDITPPAGGAPPP